MTFTFLFAVFDVLVQKTVMFILNRFGLIGHRSQSVQHLEIVREHL